MLLQVISMCTAISVADETKAWEEFVQALLHWNVLTPVLITLEDDAVLQNVINASECSTIRLKSLFHHLLFGVRCQSGSYRENVAVALLDSGVSTIIFDESAICNRPTVEETVDIQQSLSTLPRSRLGLSISTDNMLQKITKWRDYLTHFFVKVELSEEAEALQLVDAVVSCLKSTGPSLEIYLEFSSVNAPTPAIVNTILNRSEHIHVMIPPSIRTERLTPSNAYLSTVAPTPQSTPPDSNSDTKAADSIDYFTQQVKSDRPDQLITTIVCDERNQVLGLVYSNLESIALAFVEQKGIYYSRSRASIWRKGETSGMSQRLFTMRLDCDRDALKFCVAQTGGFCHLQTYSCWGHQHGPFSETGGLTHLQQLLQDRYVQAPPNSYTKRLFDNKLLLQQKLLEESQELIEAETPDEVASEAADVLYFMMVRCVQAGVSVKEIEAYLDLRAKKVTRRPGHAKDWRIAQIAQLMDTTNTSTAAAVNTSATETENVSLPPVPPTSSK